MGVLFVPVLLGNFSVLHLGGFHKFHATFWTFAWFVENDIGMLRHGAGVERGSRSLSGGHFGHGLDHDRDEGHATTRALAGFVRMDVAVFGPRAGVILDVTAGLDFSESFLGDGHQRHAAERTFSGMLILQGDVLRHRADVDDLLGHCWRAVCSGRGQGSIRRCEFGCAGGLRARLDHLLNRLAQLAFGVEHELTGSDDAITFIQAAEDCVEVVF